MNTPLSTPHSPLRIALEAEIQKSTKLFRDQSPLWRLLHYWKGNPNMRMAVGFWLLWGGLIATATGSFATAGIILGARASISALGAFTSSKGLYEVIRGKYWLTKMETLIQRAQHANVPADLEVLIQEIESTYSDKQAEALLMEHHRSIRKHAIIGNIIGTTAATAIGILTLHGGTELPSSPVSQSTPLPPAAMLSPTFDVGQIAQDIRQDHPKQGWITLEQMIRRVEGLRMGIELHQSEQLVKMNQSISQIVHHPQGIIAEALRNRGYPDHLSIDAIAQHLSEQEIKEITETYITQTHPIIDTPIAPMPHEELLHSETPLSNTSREIWLWVVWGSMVLGAGSYIGYALAKHHFIPVTQITDMNKTNDSESTLLEHSWLINEWDSNSNWNEQENISVTPSHWFLVDQIGTEQITKHEETNIWTSDIPAFQLSESALQIQKQIHTLFSTVYGWEIDNEGEITTPEKQVNRYYGNTVWWGYQVLVTYRESGIQATIVWYDHDAARSHVQSEITSYISLISPLSPEFTLESMIDTLYFDMLVEREVIKSEDMKDILAVSLPKSHLRVMYEHMEIPEVRNTNLEVLGFWMASAYEIDHQILPLNILANPLVENQTITSTSCRPKNLEIARDFYLLHPNNIIRHAFPSKESELIVRERLWEFWPNGKRKIVFSGAMRAINWHKHPDYLSRPSQGDIEEARRDLEMQYPGAETHPYTIAVRITEEEVSRSRNDFWEVILPRSVYGGQFSYALRSYQLLFENNEFKEMRPLKIYIT